MTIEEKLALSGFAVSLVALLGATAILFSPILDFTPCATEDSTWCYWDAQTRGNGQGQSFIAFGGRE